MDEGAFKQVLISLPRMDNTQLLEVSKRARALASAGPGAPDRVVSLEEDDWLLDGIFGELTARGLGKTLPTKFRIKSNRSFASYAEKSERVRVWATEQIPHMRKAEKYAFGILAARVLARKLSLFTEVNLQSMLNFVHLVPEAIEDAFPGYVSAGWLLMVIRERRALVLETE